MPKLRCGAWGAVVAFIALSIFPAGSVAEDAGIDGIPASEDQRVDFFVDRAENVRRLGGGSSTQILSCTA